MGAASEFFSFLKTMDRLGGGERAVRQFADDAARSELAVLRERGLLPKGSGQHPVKPRLQISTPAANKTAPFSPYTPAGPGVSSLLNDIGKTKTVPLDGNVFNQSANTWGGLFRSGLNGMTNAVFKGEYGNWGGALRYAAPAAIMGAAGGAFGFAGSKIWPEYMSYEGTGQAVMKGAMAGIGLGLTRKGLGSMVTKLNDIKHLDYLQKPLGVVNKIAQSKVTMGALASANFMSGFESHLTRSMNPIESV